MKGLNIRVATQDDIPILQTLEQGVIAAERPFENQFKPEPVTYYNLDELIKSDESVLIVATLQGQIVASGYAKLKAAKPYLQHRFLSYIGFIYVAPTLRGKGVAEQVLQYLEEWSISQGVNILHLGVFAQNEPAMRAYEKFGFVPHLIDMRKVI
ncbi:GNAT family N-acetyltransferase [Thalassotalea hakodatensis]|uniref:GNAT family N-acetyltransferase n=1 Tax=Thalassotalea hakodatensis TaxID=3030492 RepID=UPI0025725B67|nr:GNAT family N-acetyltransferase [Thalassotalea hakodatensis]